MPFSAFYNKLLRAGRSLLPKREETSSSTVQRLSFQDVVNDLQWMRRQHQREYLAMYSSWFGGILRDPPLMLLPMDDHLAHRGDGVFEAMKLVSGGIYLLERHLDRLARSAEMISLPWPKSREEVKEILLETVRAAGRDHGCVRLYISRGPGDFSADPGATLGSQLYVVVTTLPDPDPGLVERGCSLRLSRIPMKPGFLSKVKSCNYLPNALMAREAWELGADFTISRDEEGCLGEGATESFGMVTREEELVVPPFDRVLDGITVTRVLELARDLAARGRLRDAAERPVSPEDFHAAKEVLVFGTPLDVLPVTEFEGRPVGDGRPGTWSRVFRDLLRRDMERGSEALTPVERPT